MAIMTMKRIREGEQIPRLSGVAWRRPEMGAVVVLPMPFHVLARWLRDVYYWLMFCCDQPNRFEARLVKAFMEGEASGLLLGAKVSNQQRAQDKRRAKEQGWNEGYLKGTLDERARIQAIGNEMIADMRTRNP